MIERIVQIVWVLLAVGSLVLVVRSHAAAPGSWLLVMIGCCLIAIDKLADLQVRFYQFMQWSLHAAEESVGFGVDHHFLRGVLLVLGTVASVAAIWFLVRRDRAFDRGKLLATAGLVLIVLLVGLRMLPWFGWLDKRHAGWIVEAAAVCLIAAGLRDGFVKNRAPT